MREPKFNAADEQEHQLVLRNAERLRANPNARRIGCSREHYLWMADAIEKLIAMGDEAHDQWEKLLNKVRA